MNLMEHFANTPQPPYYVVMFTNQRGNLAKSAANSVGWCCCASPCETE